MITTMNVHGVTRVTVESPRELTRDDSGPVTWVKKIQLATDDGTLEITAFSNDRESLG